MELGICGGGIDWFYSLCNHLTKVGMIRGSLFAQSSVSRALFVLDAPVAGNI